MLSIRSDGSSNKCQVVAVHPEVCDWIRPHLGALDDLVEIFKVLADQTRLRVVRALSLSDLCVGDVAALLGCSSATASYHLRLLHRTQVADYRREGRRIYYSLHPYVKGLVIEILKHKEQSHSLRNI